MNQQVNAQGKLAEKLAEKSAHERYLDSLPPQAKSPMLNWFIDNPIAANLLMFAIVIGGVWQAMNLRLEFIDFPPLQVTITTVIEDATPEQVATNVTQRIENAISDVNGIDQFYSVSTDNSSQVSVFARNGTTVKQLAEDIRERIDNLGSLPDYAETPTVTEGKINLSLIWVSLTGDVSEKTLKKHAYALRDVLENDKDITSVNISGIRDDELRISIDRDVMLRQQLTFSTISNAIKQAVGDKPIGRIESGSGKVSVQIRGKEDSVSDYRDIVIRRNTDGYVLRLGDIATIEPTFTGKKRLSLVNGEAGVNLKVTSEGRVNIVNAVNKTKEVVKQYQETNLPNTMKALVWQNRAELILDRLRLFKTSGISAVILVFILLGLFLSPKLAFWVAVGVPISVCGAFIMMGVFDISISMISLFGFILVLGIIVDDAIVIGESIYSHKAELKNAPDATILGLSRVSTAATFGVLTTVAAFLPLSRIDGYLGQIIGDLAFVVMFCLIFSLVESKLILPSHLRHIRVPIKGEKRNLFTRLQQGIASGMEAFVHYIYQPALAFALRFRYFSLCAFISMFVFSIAAVAGGIVPLNLFPDIEDDDLSLTINMRNDVTVERTHEVARDVTKALASLNQAFRESDNLDFDVITTIYTVATDDRVRLNAELASSEIRNVSASTISERWQALVGDIDGAEKSSFGGRRRPSESDIEIQMQGKNAENLELATEYVLAKFNEMTGLTNIRDSESDGGKETYEIVLNNKAALYGINESQLASEVRAAYFGQTVKKIYQDGEEINVKLRLTEADDLTLADIYEQNVSGANGEPIPVREIATLTTIDTSQSIFRLNGMLSRVAYADVTDGVTTDEIFAQLNGEGFLDSIRQKFAVSVTLGGEEAENQKSNESLITGFLISLGLIFSLLAIPLKSFAKPFIIMSVIPFGIIGAIWGHYIMDAPLSTLSFFGVLALSGVVVNDSLVLVSTTHQYQKEGYSVADALNRTGVRRFRPVVLTSLTTYLGLLPLFFEKSMQAQFLIPMAISLGYGILFATVITLFLIPTLYYIGNDIGGLFKRKRRVLA